MRSPIVDPSHADPIAAAGSNAIGGPMGRRARRGVNWWLPVRVLLALTALSYALGYVLDVSCRNSDWSAPGRYEHLCYSDIAPLYSLRGFASGLMPYMQAVPGQTHLEYPVLTGGFMAFASYLTAALHGLVPDLNATVAFYDINVLLLFIPLAIAVVTMALTVPRRPWDAAMIALAPSVILAATINWDLLPLGFIGIGLLLWARNRPFGAGIFLGLAIAAKFYPVLFLGAFLVLALRTGKWRAFGALVGGSLISWLVVNVPVMIANFDGWAFFYQFSKVRGQDFGSVWFALDQIGITTVSPDILNTLATGLLVVLCAGIAWIALAAARRPRVPQLLFLIIAAFVVTNKVYSPQYVLWLVPLAAMARPKWRDFLIWQAGELIYFVAIWWFLVGYGLTDAKGLPAQWYGVATFVHVIVTCWLAGLIIRDIFRPEHDIVRTDGFVEDEDDPSGGPFDHAPDVFTLRSRG